jgi:ribosomal protein L37AE/L43A
MNCKCGTEMKSIYSEVKLFQGGFPIHQPVIFLERPMSVIIWSCSECGRHYTKRSGAGVEDGIMPAEEWNEPPEPKEENGECMHAYVQSFKDRHSYGHRCMHCGEVTFRRSLKKGEGRSK